MQRFALEDLPAVQVEIFTELPVEGLIVVQGELVLDVVPGKLERCSCLVIRRQCLPRIVIFEEIDPSQVQLLVRKQVSEFREVHEAPDDGVVSGFFAGIVRNDRHTSKLAEDRQERFFLVIRSLLRMARSGFAIWRPSGQALAVRRF